MDRNKPKIPHHNYYEGQLQIRNADQEMIDYIEKDIIDNDIYVAKKIKQKNGFDYNLSSRRYIFTIARKLGQKYGAILKFSSKLVTKSKQTGKDLHRLNALVQFPEYKKEDILETEHTVMQVQRMEKEKITGIDLVTSKKITITNNREIKKLEKEETQVIRTVPSIEVLDPETYQPTKLQNKAELYIGQKIQIVKSKKGLFIIN